MAKDAGEALWLGWFYAALEAHGLGIGQRLMHFANGEAGDSKFHFLRPYTSKHPDGTTAQRIHGRNSLHVSRV